MVARADLQQESWAAGEWSPWVQGRYGIARRAEAADRLHNMICTVQGPVTRRPGSLYVGILPDGERCRLIPFDLSRRRSFVLAFLPGRMWIYAHRGLVLNQDETIYEVVTPFEEDDLDCLSFARAGDRMWIACPNTQPQEIAHHDDRDWRITAVTPLFDRTDSITLSAKQGWPLLVAFHQERLVFAATRLHPQTIWMSRVREYSNFRRRTVENPLTEVNETAPDSRLILSLAGEDGDAIEWLVSSQRGLLLGTGGAEWLVHGGQGGAITPEGAAATPATSRGSSGARPITIDHQVLFVGRTENTLRALAFDFERDGLGTQDITVFARHLMQPGIAEIDWQREPDSIIWARMKDGTLRACTYDINQASVAWSSHALGGEGFVESIAVIPAADDAYDLWLAVRRLRPDGTEQRTVELIPGRAEYPTAGVDAFVDLATFCDCDPAGDILAGLEHLEGRRAQIISSGARVPDATVTGGEARLPHEVSHAVVGLLYRSELGLLPIGVAQLGAWAGKPQRYHELIIDLYRTMEGCEVGEEGGEFVPLASRVTDSPMDQAPDLVTGPVNVTAITSIEPLAKIVIRCQTPGPMAIRAVMAKTQVWER